MVKKNDEEHKCPTSKDIPFGMGSPINPDKASEGWKARCEFAREQHNGNLGRLTIFEDADQLFHACLEYFAWCGDNHFQEHVAKYDKDDGWVDHTIPKKRPFTKNGLQIYLGISDQSWRNWGKDERFSEVVGLINKSIYDQKLSGAASGFFNASVIMRDLGLADKQEISGPDGGPIEKITKEMTPKEAADAYAATRNTSN